jgi:hypothetical protein
VAANLSNHFYRVWAAICRVTACSHPPHAQLLWSIERKSHIMALVADEGLALFCGLNAMPKKSFLSEYSSRITPQKVARLLAL